MYSRPRSDSHLLGLPLTRRAPGIAVPTPTLGSAAQLERVLWIVSLLAWLVYAAYFAQLTSFPFQDYPNHLARATILADLLFHGGHRFGAAYEFQLALAPYMLHDAIL